MRSLLVRILMSCCVIYTLVIVSAIDPSLAEVVETSDERQNTTIGEDNRSTNIDESKIAKNQSTAPAGPKNFFQFGSVSGIYGGNAAVTFRWYRDIDNSDAVPDFLRWMHQERVALWTSMILSDELRAYVRGGMSNIERGTGPTYTGIGNDTEGPTLDMGFVVWDMRARHHLPLRLTSGRQALYVGRGLAYYAVNDGFQLEVIDSLLGQKYFAAWTTPRQDNIDFTVPGFDKAGDRFFYGAEWDYNGIPDITLYGYVLGQEDESYENPNDLHQSFHYDSFYYGGGFSARTGPGQQVWGEIVGETGSGYTDADRAPLRSTDVDAWAWIAGAKQQYETTYHPAIEAECAYGSGDPDRLLVTTTKYGSTDERDTNFLYFGYFAAGYALQPRLSNLYVLSAGGNFQPLESHPAFNRFVIGGKGYYYFKDQRDGGTSDFESFGNGADLGRELDAYAHWKVSDALLWSFRYGVFFPSHGFLPQSQDPTKFFYTRLSWDF